MKFGKEWNTSDKFFRPRVFCLEHAIQVNDLLESKGGAEVLVICHSDFQKIKNHAAAVADELGSKYNYDMVPLDNASVEDLNLIDRAIDEDKDENAEDWSGILGINLHHCIKMRKNSSSKHVDHALKLFDLPSDVKTSPKLVSLSLSHLKWQHTRFRSKIEIHIDHKPSSKLGSSRIKRQKKIIQYKRRKSKRKSFASKPIINSSENSAVISNDIDESGICLSEHNISVDLNDSTASVPLSTLIQVSKVAASPPVDVMCSVISDKKLKKSCSVLGACVSTGENAIVADSKLHTTGNEGEITSIYAMENSRSSYSAVRVGGPCTFENNQVNRGSSTSLEDSIECESVVQVDNRIVSVSMVRDIVADGSPSAASLESETIHAVIATSDRDSDGSLPLSLSQMCESEDPSTLLQHVSGSREEYVVGENAQLLKKASEVISAPCIEDEPSCCTITNLNQAPHGPPDNLKPPSGRKSRKRNRELEQLGDEKCEGGDFIKSPCEGLRPRSNISSTSYVTDPDLSDDEEPAIVEKRSRRIRDYASAPRLTKTMKQNSKGQHSCDLDGCTSSFKTKSDLLLHQQNQCHIQGCNKTFTCHRYLIVHQRVHADDRPLKCSWKGCNMSFKWAWARTEHLRVHTGERPYKCKAVGCGQSFRFISDFSRHRRKTGHVVDQKV